MRNSRSFESPSADSIVPGEGTEPRALHDAQRRVKGETLQEQLPAEAGLAGQRRVETKISLKPTRVRPTTEFPLGVDFHFDGVGWILSGRAEKDDLVSRL